MANYELVLDLAREFDLIMPVAYTFRYLDYANISGLGGALEYADELVQFARENSSRLPIYHHGLTHGYDYVQFDPCWTATHAEFYDFDHRQAIPETQQTQHLIKCQEICSYLHFPPLDTFVPPCHAWEPGVTDRILREHGIRYMITVPKVKFNNNHYDLSQSDYVRVLPRKSIGITHDMCGPALDKTKAQTVLHLINPMGIMWRVRYYRTMKSHSVHSYYAHITNFFPENREFWFRLLNIVRNRRDLIFPRSSAEAHQLCKEALTHYAESSHG